MPPGADREKARLQWIEQRRISAAMQEADARRQRLQWKQQSDYYDQRRQNTAIPYLNALWWQQMNWRPY